jgi:hypothetical protein
VRSTGDKRALPSQNSPTTSSTRRFWPKASFTAIAGDLDEDGLVDLAVAGTKLNKGQVPGSPQTGGVLVYAGGMDWSVGPTYDLYPPQDDPAWFGTSLALVDTGQARFLAIGATDYVGDVKGAIFLVELGDDQLDDLEEWSLLLPPDGLFIAGRTGFAESITWLPDYVQKGHGALVTGMRYADADGVHGLKGAIALFPADDEGSIATEADIIGSPVDELNFNFGNNVYAVGDVDDDGWSDLAASHATIGVDLGSNLYLLR